ncbi:DUF362 domain-containing protein [candidate division WOR-3 bacterium]|nr:DUF362 domain-containing protein [candidate division WOR-3 bacterium]
MLGKSKENIGLLLKYIKHHFKRTKNKYTGIKSVLLFPIIGLLSLLWVIIRVAPKPSRLRYPCMKVAVPTAASFVAYIIAIFASLFSFRKAKENLRKSRYSLGIILLLISIAGGTFLILHTNQYASAQTVNLKTRDLEANDPMGEEKGIFPGRVVWVHDPDATNEDCDPGDYGHGWFLNENNNQSVIDAMLDTAVKVISGQTDIAAAWDTIFRYNNNNRGKGNVGYQAGEIIFIKVNRTSSWTGNINFPSYDPADNGYYGVSETSPHLILALLRHLVDSVGVAEDDIYIGDPMKHLYSHDYDLWYGEYPDIHYLDHDRSDAGREIAAVGDSMIHYSDSGAVLRADAWSYPPSGDPIYDDHFYAIFEDCDYLINVPTLKGHVRAGATMFAKNHFGSHTRGDASHLHMGLVDPDGNPNNGIPRSGYGLYRVLVDLMGWKLIREKNVIFLMDALWSAGAEVTQPTKWKNAPFNDDWSSSIFISQDNVAIESVGFDFLQTEYTSENHPGLTYVQMEGTDDYLEQAADSANWTDSIPFYDPEDDGTPMPWSLGVHEHWNNETDRQYSRNLGGDYGIELVKILPEIVPAITITSPNGGEDWYVGSDYNITWTSSNTSGNVQIEYSTNNGSSWTEEVASTADDGSYSWTVPDAPSDNCLVRVSDTEGTPADTSDAVFSILPVPSYITITSPNGGEYWYVDSTYNITWTSSNTSGNVQIEYSVNNGSSWTEEIASTPDDGSYSWTVPDTPSDNCLVRVSDTEGSPSDISDAVFWILPSSVVPLDELSGVYSMSVKRVTADKNFEIRYTLPEETTLRFGVYDITGKIIREFSKEQMQGSYSEKIDMRGEPAGVYFVRMEANGRKFTQTNKVLLVK